MPSYQDTDLYRRAFALPAGDDPDRPQRERLSVALSVFCERAARLAARIATDLPGFTSHDIEHIDALWATADVIVGEDYIFTPTEAFVFGGAALLHDLALTMSAYLDGPRSVEAGADWADQLSLALRRELDRDPSPSELENPSEPARQAAREGVLRARHAARAGELATQPLAGPDGPIYLLDDEDLRADLGWLIGRIAASHGSDSAELAFTFATSPIPKGFPRSWKVDSLSLACLLRCADAAQLDGRRARALQQAIQSPQGTSADHWNFQRWLHPAYLHDDRLIFASTRPFPGSSADAWWLAFDWLGMADQELRAADALLSDRRPKRRFAARSVASVGSPARMAERIQTDGWLPVDARLHVSSVAELARRLGGRHLYGTASAVPVRELLQNAMDAIRARNLLEGNERAGSVDIRESREDGAMFLEVCDQGVGMTPEVLSGPLLDFGNSLWRSEGVATHLPGLAGKGFRSYGRFGIGFFAAFMWSEEIQVRSRSYLAGVGDTHVLAFSALGRRPLLRTADPSECLSEPGTAVRLHLPSASLDGLDPEPDNSDPAPDTTDLLVPWIAPSAEVDIWVQRPGKRRRRVVRADDWRSMPANKLMQRILGGNLDNMYPSVADMTVANMRPIEQDGEMVGRGALIPRISGFPGVLTVGGLRTQAYDDFAGVLLGESPNVARTEARPVASNAALEVWLSEQADLLASRLLVADILLECAEVVVKCGASPGSLPICLSAQGPLSIEELRAWVADQPGDIFIINLFDAEDISSMDQENFEPAENVLVVEESMLNVIPRWYDTSSGPVPGRTVQQLVRHTVIDVWYGPEGQYEGAMGWDDAVIGSAYGKDVSSGYYLPLLRPDSDDDVD
jgi:hypothetical protein